MMLYRCGGIDTEAMSVGSFTTGGDFSKLTKQKDRGGLAKPASYVFSIVQAADRILR